MYPFTHFELSQDFDLTSVLRWGSLPRVFDFTENDERIDFLNSYTDSYLREEIVAEQIVRNIIPFRQFLEVAGQSNAKIINYRKVATAINVETSTVQNYYQILEDTFIGFLLPPYHESIRNRQRKNPKFYFFDIGVARALQNRLTLEITPQTYEYGELFEPFIILEMIRLNHYFKKSWRFSYITTKDGVEVDLVIERPGKRKIFVEIKSASQIHRVADEKLTGFKKLVQDSNGTEGIVLSQDRQAKSEDGIRFLHWRDFFQEMFT